MPEMIKRRLLFSKLGRAAFISHLDLMRTFQRAFIRAGIDIWHTEGFNPHPYIAIALPLSVGQESVCELLDFGLLKETGDRQLIERLNSAMPDGIRVLRACASARPLNQLAYVRNTIRLTFDDGIPGAAVSDIGKLFESESITVLKKLKKGGEQELNIKPLIKELSVAADGNDAVIDAVLRASELYLNHSYLVKAVEDYLPGLRFDEAQIRRVSLLDREMKEFI
jgi:radical SAM-linked protein